MAIGEVWVSQFVFSEFVDDPKSKEDGNCGLLRLLLHQSKDLLGYRLAGIYIFP
jgi:hypothetical protein